ncbi:MAG TPA: DUF305 domain-containing protein [Azospirillaceae bacterium]|nr:DUF305 domain-containing protein [Azospirillaceae bacterium]
MSSHSLPTAAAGVLAALLLAAPVAAQDRAAPGDRTYRDQPNQEGERRGGALSGADMQAAQALALHNQRGIELSQICAAQAEQRDLVDHCRDSSAAMRRNNRRLADLTGDPRLGQVAAQEDGAAAGDRPRSPADQPTGQVTDLSSVLSDAADALGLPGATRQGTGTGRQDAGRAREDQQRHRQQVAQLQRAQGEEFDDLFLTTMIRHHRDGLRASDDCHETASGEELRQLCRRMGSAQERDMAQLEDWRRDWFGNRTSTTRD